MADEKREIMEHKCIVAVTEGGNAILLKSEPDLSIDDVFYGIYLSDNINKNIEDIPKEFGVYTCDIMVEYIGPLGYYMEIWIDNVVNLDLV